MRRFIVVNVVVLLAVTASAPVQTHSKKAAEATSIKPVEANGKIEGYQAERPTGPAALGKNDPASRRAPSSVPCDVPPIVGSSVKTFGYYSPTTGRAVEGEVWTFDHVGGDPWEGWKIEDLTTDNFTAFQHIDPTKWGNHPNTPAPPIINGMGSAWIGFHEDEADSACWEAGLGYGDNWAQQLRSPGFTNSSGDSVLISFDYWYDCESGFDFVRVIVDDGTPETIATFTGQGGAYHAPLQFSQKVAVTGTFELRFEFTSDFSYSDEDDLYSTVYGPFAVDDIDVVGLESYVGPGPPYDFDMDLQGWTAEPIPGVGSFAGLNDWSGYALTGCGQSDNVISLHNGSLAHTAGQRERLTSPAVDISSYGTAPLNVWAEYDNYTDMPSADDVFWTWGFQYYPVVCPVTGDSTWSDPDGPSLWFYNDTPVCQRFRSYANDLTTASVESSGKILVPAGSDSLRFVLEIEARSGSEMGNESPFFDNIEIGVSSAASVVHVPSPQYPDITSAIAGTSANDTIVVRAGVYTGAANRDLDFDGTDRVLISEEGRTATFIVCQYQGRGLYFHNGETSSTVINGFTFVRGTRQLPGALLYNIGASPTIRNCAFKATRVTGAGYGVVRTDSGDPAFECVTVASDTSVASGGVVIVNGGYPTFESCLVANNDTQFSTVSLIGGAPWLEDCWIILNITTNAVILSTSAAVLFSHIEGNYGVGMYLYPAAASIISNCVFDGNEAGGIILESNSSSFSQCSFRQNLGPGITIRNVVTAAASERREGMDKVAAAGTTPPFVDCTISGNVNTASNGGGILFDCSNTPASTFAPTYTNCIITGNSSLFNGGGIAVCGQAYLTDIAPVFQNCTISANNALGAGGGMYMSVENGASETYQGWVTMDRSIMWDNCAGGVGAQAYMEGYNYITFDCSDVDSTGLDGSGTIIYGGKQAYDDPGFCESPDCSPEGTIEGSFFITMGSPADSLQSPCGQLIGANPVLCLPPIGAGDTYDVPEQTALAQNVPNPFNPTTAIQFDVAHAGHVALEVYDVQGRLVRTLVDEHMTASRRSVVWNGVDNRGHPVTSGVYFARLQVGNLVETRKMVMLK